MCFQLITQVHIYYMYVYWQMLQNNYFVHIIIIIIKFIRKCCSLKITMFIFSFLISTLPLFSAILIFILPLFDFLPDVHQIRSWPHVPICVLYILIKQWMPLLLFLWCWGVCSTTFWSHSSIYRSSVWIKFGILFRCGSMHLHSTSLSWVFNSFELFYTLYRHFSCECA